MPAAARPDDPGARCRRRSGWPAPTASPPPCSRSTPPNRSTGATSPMAQATSTRPTSATSSRRSPGSRRPGTSKSGSGFCANIPATRWTAGRCRPIDFLQDRQLTKRQPGGTPKQGEPVGKVVMYASVSVDGFIADENDQPGPLFDWLTSGEVPLDESGVLKVSQTSYDYTRPYWDQIGAA